MQQPTATLIVGGLGIFGTLGGILIGQYMARSWQREQWLLDRKNEEYRELITTMTETFTLYHLARREGVPVGPQQQIALSASDVKTIQTLRNRVLIARDLTKKRFTERWIAACHHFDHHMDGDAFTATFHELCNELVDMAVKDSEKRNALDDILKRIGDDIASSS